MNIKQAVRGAIAECRSYVGQGKVVIQNEIPTYADLTSEEQAAVDAGAEWPVRIRLVEIPEHEWRLLEVVISLGVAGGAFADRDTKDAEVMP